MCDPYILTAREIIIASVDQEILINWSLQF